MIDYELQKQIEDNVLYNIETVSKEIFKMKEIDPDRTYLECIVEYADEHEIHIDDMKELLSQSLLSELEIECENLHLIKKEGKLDI